MTGTKKIAVVAMSGGVDSSVAALLLMNAGYEVIGLTAVMFEHDCAMQAVNKAKSVCDTLGIRHEYVDISKDFKKYVVDYFENSYKTGYTPNPCTVCNRYIKWGVLRKYAEAKLNADLYATGHYAQIVENNGVYKLAKPLDLKKDQTYMLFALTQDDLSKTRFPLGGLEKTQVKEIAAQHGFVSAQIKESQDVCFIQPPDTAKKYLERVLGESDGAFVDVNTGKVLGKHTGAYKYTIGQRKGIGIAASEPLYVVSTDVSKNIVYVGYKNDLFVAGFEAVDVNWQLAEYSVEPFESLVKIRYNSPPTEAQVIPVGECSARIIFKDPQSAVTPGQAAVFYDLSNDFVIGGGWIK